MGNIGMRYPVREDQKIILHVAGDLQVTAGTESEVVVYARRTGTVQVRNENNLITLTSGEDANLVLPAGTNLRVEHAGGDAILSGLTGLVEIVSVGGDLRQNGAGMLDVSHVGGDMHVSGVSEALTVRRVGGDFVCDVPGAVTAEMVGGDCIVSSTAMRLRAGGDIDARLPANLTEEINIKAGGDISLFLPAGLAAQLDLSSGKCDILLDVEGHHGEWQQENVVVALGENGPRVRVRAGGDVQVLDPSHHDLILESEFDHLGEDIAAQFDDHMWPTLDAEYWAGVEQRVQERAAEAARRAEERVRKAIKRMERDSKRSSRREGPYRHEGFFPPDVAAPVQPPQPAAAVAEEVDASYPYAASVTNEERMLVLKMLQEHKINVEEAEQLLAELEGQFD